MPKRQLDPKDKKNKPTGLKAAAKGKKWVQVDRVGGWEPVLAEETAVLTDTERAEGDRKITREDREAAKTLEKELGRAATKAEREAKKAELKAAKQEARQAERQADKLVSNETEPTDVQPA